MKTSAAIAAALLLLGSFSSQAGFLSSRYGDFKELVDAGKPEAAWALLQQEPQYFAELKGDKKELVERFRARWTAGEFVRLVNERHDDEALQKLKQQRPDLERLDDAGRQQFKTALSIADARRCDQLNRFLNALRQHNSEARQTKRWSLLKADLPKADEWIEASGQAPAELRCVGRKSQELKAVVTALRSDLQADVRPAFLSYGAFSEPAFPLIYPIAGIAGFNSIQANPTLGKLLQSASPQNLRQFVRIYSSSLDEPTLALASQRYLSAVSRERGANDYFARLSIRESMVADGFRLTDAKQQIALAVWSNSEQYALTPPDQATYREATATQTPSDITKLASEQGRSLFVFCRLSPTKSERTLGQAAAVRSTYRSSTRQIPNPDYAEARQQLAKAERDARESERKVNESSNSNDSSTSGTLMALASLAVDAGVQSALRSAQRRFDETPPMIDEPVLTAYEYTVTPVHIKQSYQLHYAFYDPIAGTTVTGMLDRGIEQDFRQLQNVQNADPNVDSILASGVFANKIDEWEKAKLKVEFNKLWPLMLDEYKNKVRHS